MAANRRRLVHRLQAEDPLDLSASERYTLGRIGLARLGRPDILSAPRWVSSLHIARLRKCRFSAVHRKHVELSNVERSPPTDCMNARRVQADQSQPRIMTG